MSKRVWFFDLDGTLADTDADIRGAWKAALTDLGLSVPNFDRDFIAGPPIEEMARKLLPDIFTEQLAQDIRTGFGRHYDGDGFPNTFEYPGIMDAVRGLKARGDGLYIATNKRYAGASAMSKRFGWDIVFDGLYTGDMHKDDPIGKLRKPQLLKLIMDEIGAKPENCIMVGDTINDFEAANVNRMESVGVAWGYGGHGDLAHATRVISSPDELLNI